MESYKGFIKLFRTILDWEWFCDVNACHLFIYCLLKANFQDKVWRGKKIERGTFITSYNTISEETGLSRQNIKTALKKLTKLITHKSTNRNTIISIKNYDNYCGPNTQTNSQTNQQLTTTKNVKKNIKETLSLDKITNSQREILKKYLLRQKRKPDNLNAYISTLIKNGDWRQIVEQETLREKRISEKKKNNVSQEQTLISEDEDKKIREIQKQIAQMFKNKP